MAYNTMESAPKDGTLLKLLVSYDVTDPGCHPLNDSDEPGWTIGFNALSDTGVDEWELVGWDWEQDMFRDSRGTPIGWLPFFTGEMEIE